MGPARNRRDWPGVVGRLRKPSSSERPSYTPRMRIRALAFAGLGLLALVALGVFLASARYTSASRVEIPAAQADALWAHVPAWSDEQSRYVVRADAGWVPWANPVTNVGRYYRTTRGSVGVPSSWAAAATSAGWKQVRARCGVGKYVFTKHLGGETARLIVELEETKTYLRAAISFGQRLGSDPVCLN